MVLSSFGIARQNNSAITLNRECGSKGIASPNEGNDFAGIAEGRIEAAVCVVARQGKLVRCSFVLVTSADYQFAIELQCDGTRRRAGISDAGKMGLDLAAAAESWVQAPINVVTGQHKVIKFTVGPAPLTPTAMILPSACRIRS